LCSSKGSQFADIELCSLNLPEETLLMSLSMKAQTAEAPIELMGVEKVA
jgi:hypothetical protein